MSSTSIPPITSLKLSFDDMSTDSFLKSRGKRVPKPVGWGMALATMALAPPSMLLLSPIIAISQLQNKFKSTPPPVPCLIPEDLATIPTPIPLEDREYDIIVLGATGFTGDLALQYLMSTYATSGLKIAIAGRNVNKLADKLVNAAGITGCPKSFTDTIGTIVVDTSSPDQIKAMCNQGRVVMTTVGPFAIIGTGVVESCALTGTHYCDITGETGWVRENTLLLSAAAAQTGAKIVSLCGHDSIPWDLSFNQLARAFPEGENVASVTIGDDIVGAVSGGTVATLIHAFEGKASRDLSRNAWFKGDPMGFVGGKTASLNKTKNTFPFNPFAPFQSPFDKNSRLGFFLMSTVNGDAIKRGVAVNSLGLAGQSIAYREGKSAPDWKSAVVSTLIQYLSLAVVAATPIRNMLMGGMVPSPGQGPTLKQQATGYLRVLGEAVGDKGTVVKSCMYFDVDPGYKDTSRMLAESAMTLKEGGAGGVGGGVYTPGAAMPDMLLERLCATGTQFAIKVEK